MTTPLLVTAAARDAAPCGDVVSLDRYRERRRAAAAAPVDATLAAAAGAAFTLDRFLERARLVLLEGGGAGTPPASPASAAPLRLA
jgi:hypothetical protein